MKRFFYTDPLAAAWMAKQFGMCFYPDPDGDTFSAHEFHLSEKGFYGDWNMDAILYIHPDSLHLLDPKVGDLAWWSMKDGGGCLCEATPMLITQGGVRSIIQRKGVAFMWPESEEA
jgi:hypothetical protein